MGLLEIDLLIHIHTGTQVREFKLNYINDARFFFFLQRTQTKKRSNN